MNQLDFENLKYQYGKENLSNIFNTELDLFPSVKTSQSTGQINLWELFQKIRSNLICEITPTVLLTNKYVNGEKNSDYTKIKTTLPAVCYNATFKGRKNNDNVEQITNLMFMEIDDLESKNDAEELKQELTKKYEWIVACYRSLSGLGLHLIVAVDHINDSDDYKNKYAYVNEHYFNDQLDSNAKRLTQYTILPYDFNIYINESPSILKISEEFQEYHKGLSSVNESFLKKITYTPYTFLGRPNTNLNIAARDRGLKFKVPVDEKWFTDHNTPIHSPDGELVVELNLYPFMNSPVQDGDRTRFLWVKTTELLWLNGQTSSLEEFLRFISWINKKFCEPELPYQELVKVVEHLWNKYHQGEIDFTNFQKRKHSFWSPKCSLSANEKRTVTCRLNNAAKLEKNILKIHDAIEDLFSDGNKITQKKVAEKTGIGLSTLKQKKYWGHFKEMVREMNWNI